MGWFAQNFVADQWRVVLATSISVPIITEIIVFVIVLLINRQLLLDIQSPQVLKELWVADLKEHTGNLAQKLGFWMYMPFIIGAAVCVFSFSILNPLLAGVLFIISLCGLLWTVYHWIGITKTFRRFVEETNTQFYIRGIRNVLLVIIAVCIIEGISISIPTLSNQLHTLYTNGDWPDLGGNPTIITVEYLTVGFIHFYQGLARLSFYNKKRVLHGLYHLATGGLAFYLQLYAHHKRFHHDFLGLLLQTIPLRPIQFTGLMYTIDSMMYQYTYYRVKYDYANIMEDYWMYILPAVMVACIIELCTKVLRWALLQQPFEYQQLNNSLESSESRTQSINLASLSSAS